MVFTRADNPTESPLMCHLPVVAFVELSVRSLLGHTNGQIDGQTDGQCHRNCGRVHEMTCPIFNAMSAPIRCFHFQCEEERQDRIENTNLLIKNNYGLDERMSSFLLSHVGAVRISQSCRLITVMGSINRHPSVQIS